MLVQGSQPAALGVIVMPQEAPSAGLQAHQVGNGDVLVCLALSTDDIQDACS